ncbi:hypothetical protein CAPTEDRAFT_215470 [Capitella teleta]|uniref:Uncharacterized protein n=1 Tax=Capitella teleta TaxID=283909 RepID=R7U615_CAPTE|nr:hypothetical protein CAPTEDRAFT_215470 [Capitella teleta]|eukprot:ELT99136.1 hypothetical protein CAPTEDRAFT_215470 [Capitella teleta]
MEGICDVLEESQLFDMGSLKTAVPLISTWREDASELETSTLRTDIIEDITHEPDLVLSSFLKMLPINNNNATDTNNVMDISAISAAISSDSDSDHNSVADVIGTLDKPLDIEATKSQKMSNKLVQRTARGHKKTAKLKFKWYKSFETEESEVELIGSWTEDPIPLKRSVLDPVVYESDELEVICGVLPESKLCIAPDHELTLEQILIQHYTFEVHLYLDGLSM